MGDKKLIELTKILKEMESVLIAYSGGVDSTFLMKVAKDALGDNVLAVTAKSETYSRAEHEEAVKIARTLKPSLILLDILMPKVDGYTACIAIKNDHDTREIPVIMLTGVDHEMNRKFAMEMGADGYLVKPFKLRELKDIINEFLNLPQ